MTDSCDTLDGPRCICGEAVAVPHRECMTLLTPDERARYDKGRPLRTEDNRDR